VVLPWNTSLIYLFLICQIARAQWLYAIISQEGLPKQKQQCLIRQSQKLKHSLTTITKKMS